MRSGNSIYKGLRRFVPVDLWRRSFGDWRYPFMEIGWGLANYLTRARKVSVDGVQFTLPCNNWITHFRWFLLPEKEPEVRQYINDYVRDGDVFFDIGANVGIFSIYAAKRHPKVKVFSFEPEYSNLALLKEGVLRNGVQDRVAVYSIGISDSLGLSQLHLQDTQHGAAAHTESRETISKTDSGFQVVATEGIVIASIDYVCEELGVYPNALKIDTDGNELKILNGAHKTLANPALKSLIIELDCNGPLGESCSAVLQRAGFTRVWANAPTTPNEIWVRQ